MAEKRKIALVALNFSIAFFNEVKFIEKNNPEVSGLLVSNYEDLDSQLKEVELAIVYYHACFVTEKWKDYAKQTDELVNKLKNRGVLVGTIFSDTSATVYPRVVGDFFDRVVREPGLESFLSEKVREWLDCF